MKARLIPVLALALSPALSGAAPAGPEPTALLRDWAAANTACRGGSGDDPRTLDACARRDGLDARLSSAGWCYGRPGDAGYQRVWRRCAEIRR